MRDLNDPQRPDCVAIINAVVALAKQLQMNTVAEGVETVDHLRTVSAAGCEVQGFYFSKPVQASEVQAILSQVPKRLAASDDVKTS